MRDPRDEKIEGELRAQTDWIERYFKVRDILPPPAIAAGIESARAALAKPAQPTPLYERRVEPIPPPPPTPTCDENGRPRWRWLWSPSDGAWVRADVRDAGRGA